ncbi:hypothetical protein MMC14_003335 [Varicellaria rhodocarpa]|nr:hypothetical protein [Varicellaria rhodocarpa]
MASRIAKRQRTSTIATSVPSVSSEASTVIDFLPLLEIIPKKSIHAILDAAAKQDPVIANLIKAEHKRLIAAEQQKTLDFDYLSKSAWKSINVDYCDMSSSKQYRMSGNAFREVRDCIETIATGCPPHASFGTKRSALETLRKIGKSICLSGDGNVVGDAVRSTFQWMTQLEDTMYKIAISMTVSERDTLMKTQFKSKLYELEKLGKSDCLYENLSKVIDLMEGRAVEDVDAGDAEDKVGREGDLRMKIPVIDHWGVNGQQEKTI